jgi:hypothetical protein
LELDGAFTADAGLLVVKLELLVEEPEVDGKLGKLKDAVKALIQSGVWIPFIEFKSICERSEKLRQWRFSAKKVERNGMPNEKEEFAEKVEESEFWRFSALLKSFGLLRQFGAILVL